MRNHQKNLLIILTSTFCYTQNVFGELTLSPPPVVEGVADAEVTLKVKELELGMEGEAFRQYISKGYEETKVYLLELSSDTPYWLDYMSSMGATSRGKLMEWVGNTLLSKYKEKERLSSIVESDSILASFFGGAPKASLKEGVDATANFIGKLLFPYADRAAIDRSYYSASTKICPFSQRMFSFILVDPDPFQGPDKKSYLIVIENLYEE